MVKTNDKGIRQPNLSPESDNNSVVKQEFLLIEPSASEPGFCKHFTMYYDDSSATDTIGRLYIPLNGVSSAKIILKPTEQDCTAAVQSHPNSISMPAEDLVKVYRFLPVLDSDPLLLTSPEPQSPFQELSYEDMIKLFNQINFAGPREETEKKTEKLRSALAAIDWNSTERNTAANKTDVTEKLEMLLSECLTIAGKEGVFLTLLQLLGKTISKIIQSLFQTHGEQTREMYTTLSLQTLFQSMNSGTAKEKLQREEQGRLSALFSPDSDCAKSNHASFLLQDLTDNMLKSLYRSKAQYDSDQFTVLFFKSSCQESDKHPNEIWDQMMLTDYLGDFSTKIREQRLKKKWTQAELAAVSQVDRSMIAKIEKLHAFPTLETAFKLMVALDLKPEIIDSSIPVHNGSVRDMNFENSHPTK